MKFLLVADRDNAKYYTFAKHALRGHQTIIPRGQYDVLSMHLNAARKERVDAIILSHSGLLAKAIVHQLGKAKESGSLMDWAGTCFNIEGLKIIVVRPFAQLITTDTAEFLLRWHVRKHFSPAFPDLPELQYCAVTHESQDIQALYEKFQQAIYIAVDIETYRQPISETKYMEMRDAGHPVVGLAAHMKLQTASGKNSTKKGWCIPKITMIGYCGLFKTPDGKLDSFSVVLHIKSMEDIYWMRKFNALEAPKICQNGGYEATHLIRYNAPLHNWLCDTFHFMHSWFAELPRDLAFISSMYLRNFQYWKEEAGSDMVGYNAKDTYNTLWSWVIMVSMAPDWAKNNYLIEFRKCFPAITCGLEGFLVDPVERDRLREVYEAELAAAQARLAKLVYAGFNPNSSQQVLAVLNAFSITKFKSSDTKSLDKFGEQGNLQAMLAELITNVRESKKKLSTYINTSLLDGRLLYEINHGGTDTGRASSKASNLWVGTQIQNQDNMLRTMYIADGGWLIANCDGSQAESRTTAYISEDATLIETVETAKDFHTRNASLFFGIPEDEIVKIIYETVVVDGCEIQRPVLGEDGKPKKDKSIRDLSKRVNHGSNYNMAEYKLLQTMGTKNVMEAQRLLKLPATYSLINVCTFLLTAFINTYPDVKGKYYDEVIEEIAITGMLVGATGWTRRCFGKPSRERRAKLALNKYVAHGPQSLSVMLVDEAEFEFWQEYQIRRGIARLKAQVHDEVVYMVKPEHYEITKPALSSLMSKPLQIKGRTLIIPNDGGSADVCWGKLKD